MKVGWAATEDAVNGLVTALIKESMGRVLAMEREAGELVDVPCTAREKFSLLLGKYSIDDGDVLLSREDPTYVNYVIDEVKQALAREGYTAHLGAMSTCHNPFRYWEEDGRFYIFGPNGYRPSQEQLEAFLCQHEFEIWVFDFDQVGRLTKSVEASVMWT